MPAACWPEGTLRVKLGLEKQPGEIAAEWLKWKGGAGSWPSTGGCQKEMVNERKDAFSNWTMSSWTMVPRVLPLSVCGGSAVCETRAGLPAPLRALCSVSR